MLRAVGISLMGSKVVSNREEEEIKNEEQW